MPTEKPGWLLLAGVSAGKADFFESNLTGYSASLRGGVRLPAADVSLVGEHWNDWANLRVTSVLLETNYLFNQEATVSPLVLLGVGYVWRESRRVGASASDLSGAATSLGIGAHARLTRSTALRAEAVLRDDDGTFDGQLRLAFGYAGAAPHLRPGLSRPTIDLVAYGMAPLRGPWQFVEPGYMARYTRPYSELVSGTLALGVFHWENSTDTRAFVGTTGVQLRLAPDDLLSVRGGPAVFAMGEGPDAGANLGAHLEAATVLRPIGLPITLGVGSLWMPRGSSPNPRVSPGVDQIGMTFFGGLHF